MFCMVISAPIWGPLWLLGKSGDVIAKGIKKIKGEKIEEEIDY